MELEFSGEVWEWRGPAPYHFVWVPEDEAEQLQETAAAVTYGWGMIPVTVTIGDTAWTTSLWPRDGSYVVPLKDRVRRAEAIELGMVVDVRLQVDV
ncbi:DUF1905 domain-containing protein [Nocardioides sp. URHA0032]|uniref:DUF1905 domain-containing protein n=1 Tax=Nocardioides sp. URHA0032 TaxID=1380388 RepID=UPI00048F1FB7|nr:DUF1905 domain-containing protein [Nocardioides sp. URHA0032]